MNPSVGQILEAITAVNAEHVIVLPNNPQRALRGRERGGESTKDVRVIETDSVPEGIAGAFAFDATRSADENEAGMREAIDAVTAAEITRASRDATVDGVTAAEGDFLAIVDGTAVSADESLWVVLDALLDRFAGDGLTYVQLIRGEGAPDARTSCARSLAAREIEVDVQLGRPAALPAPPLRRVSRVARPPRRGQRGLPLVARAPARAPAGTRGRGCRRERLRRAAGGRASSRRTSS